MDFLKNQIPRIQQQLSSLTASQRMLTAALVAIMVMTLVYWGRYAGTAEMEPLLDQAFLPNDIANITPRLKGLGIAYDVQGDRIMVPAEKKWEALADIAYAKMLPRNTATGFQEMSDKLKPWAAPTERDAMFNNVREGMCAQIIQHFPNVEHAAVMINAETRRSIGHNTEPSATVEISTANGEEAGKQLVDAAAATVVGSTPGLKTSNVQVIINGIHMRTGSSDLASGMGAETQLELQQKHEEYAAKKIRELLREIPGVFVSAAVKVDASETEQSEQSFDKDKSLSQLKRSTETKNETNGGSAAPAEPGAVPNTSVAKANEAITLDGGGSSGEPSNSESTTSDEFDNHAGSILTKTKKPAGTATLLSASVRVPRSHFVNLWRSNNPGKSADDAAVEEMIKLAVPTIRASVMRGSAIESEDKIAVEAYPDMIPQLALAGAPTTATMSIPTTIGKFGKEIALGGLALVSLFMVSMMVRKSAPPAVIPAPAPVGPPPTLVASEAVAGEAGDGNPLLSGMELDEDAIVTQQMLEQVTTMVTDNPDGAASLVKRWLNRT
jgi:flagellar biosynthesis/type III secretory pathway M-ring protein FliF/YscJ